MTHELVLTSVSQGLEPKSHGFCSVAETAGIPPQLVMRLKSISDYRHLFEPDSDDAAKNPVVYSYLIAPGTDTTYHILSRISDAGTDYQHQPNRLAHHIILKEEEEVPEGPAWVLAQSGFQFTQWLTPAVRFQQGRPLPSLTAPPPLTRLHLIERERQRLDPTKMSFDNESGETTTPSLSSNATCPLWKQLTGDAGWAGVLAATVRSGRQAVILFQPGMNVLPLFVEALSLIPPSMRWKATFSTCFTGLPEHVICQWKAIPVGAPEAKQFSADDPSLLVLDLTLPLGKAPRGAYVEYARHGSENSLPDNEIQAELFEDSGAGFIETSTDILLPSNVQPPQDPQLDPKKTEATPPPFEHQQPSVEDTLPNSVSAITPPVQASEAFRIRTSDEKSKGVVSSLINMKSRRAFYTLFGAAFLGVLLLSVVLADQLLHLGLLKGTASKTNVESSNKQGDGSKNPNGKKSDPGKLAAEALDAQRQREAQELEKKKKELEELNKQRLEAAEKARFDASAKLIHDTRLLNDLLQEFDVPKALSFPIPDAESPTRNRVFKEFTPFYPCGSAIQFEFVPLLKNRRVLMKTERRTRYLDEKPTTAIVPTAEPTSKLDGPAPPEVEDTDDESEQAQPNPEHRIPDPSRLEWTVFGVDNLTGRRTPLLGLKLTPEGLDVAWLDDALQPQFFDDVALLSLGFLRVGPVGPEDLSKIRSIPLFKPVRVDPVYPSKVFSDPEKSDYTVPMPFADEPWKSIFAEENIPCLLQLHVEIEPESPAGIEKIDVIDMKTPTRYFVNLETNISARKTETQNRETLVPIPVSVEAIASPTQIVWTDRINDQKEVLETELEANKAQLDESTKELNEIRQKIMNIGGGKVDSELAKHRNELNDLVGSLKNRNKELDDTIAKYPGAHDKLVKNDELRFNYSVSLLPTKGSDPSDENRLPNEKSILLLESREPAVETPKTTDETKKEPEKESAPE